MVTFPNTAKTFSDIVDGTNFMEGDQMNQSYDEIEALEQFVGAIGAVIGQTDSMTSVLREYRNGCACVPDTVAQITVEAGEIFIQDASGNMKLRRNTSGITVTWADIDTGAEATSTIYYVYAVADSAATTFTILISTNAATPTGATFFRRIGKFFNNGSDNIINVVSLDLHLTHDSEEVIKAWINMDGTGTIAIKDSFNVISIADSGTGHFVATWDVDFASINYVVTGTCSARTWVVLSDATVLNAGFFDFICNNNVNASIDVDDIMLQAIGDQ